MQEILMLIAAEAGLFGTMRISTIKLAGRTEMSQQSISRKLIAMEELGLIRRKVSVHGMEISLEEKGRAMIKAEYQRLKKIVERKQWLCGRVEKGLGEGQYYMKVYSKKIRERLGFSAYQGTLNLCVDEVEMKDFISGIDGIFIEEFKQGNRTFGAISCHPVTINEKVKGAILVPVRSTHKATTLELIAPMHLRTALHLRDGSRVRLTT